MVGVSRYSELLCKSVQPTQNHKKKLFGNLDWNHHRARSSPHYTFAFFSRPESENTKVNLQSFSERDGGQLKKTSKNYVVNISVASSIMTNLASSRT